MEVKTRFQLPTILQKQHIARIEGDALLIHDRRRYPLEDSFVTCLSVDEVAQAIQAMVTQGGGPLQVAMTTVRFIARQIHERRATNTVSTFVSGAQKLIASRPTNTTMARTLRAIVAEIGQWYRCDSVRDLHGDDLVFYIDEIVNRYEKSFDTDYDAMSDHGAALLGPSEGILTTCFAEHSFILTLMKAREQGKRLVVYIPETRPYLQGARLTAPALQELGFESYVITDGMGAHFLREGAITTYLTAADLVTMDGTVVNKVGTLANAIACAHYGVPYHAFSMAPDETKATQDEIIMEERDGVEVLRFGSVTTTLDSLKGKYPAFDCIDANLITSIITPRGVFTPQSIETGYAPNSDTKGAGT